MDFFVILDGQLRHCALFRIAASHLDNPIGSVVDKFVDDIHKNGYPSFDPSRYKLYIDDISNLTSYSAPVLIQDWTKPLKTIEYKKFDLILSINEPPPTHQPPQEVEESIEVVQQQMFDDSIQQAKIALYHRDYKTTNFLIQKARKLKKDDPEPLHIQVRLYMKLHRFKMAIEFASSAIRLFPSDKTALMLSARAHQRAGLHEDAIEIYKRVFLFSPHNTTEYDDINTGIARSLLALDCPDQAMSLMTPIYNTNPLNMKATVLLGKIFARQGRLSEGLHYVMRNFSIEPDHKASRKFIGEHIFNERQAELLRAELGDGTTNPFVMFYVGHILNEYGSCGAAQYFFNTALKFMPTDPAIAVGCIKNNIVICIETQEIIDIAAIFLPKILARTDVFNTLLNGFDIQKIEKDFDLKVDIPPQPCQKVEQGTKDAQFKIEQYDTLWFMIILEGFLFSRGYITAAEIICKNVQNIVSQYSFSKTVISQEINYHLYISSLVPTVPRPLVVLRRFFIIGDEHCLSLAWRMFNFKGEPHIFVPIVIDGLHPTHIVAPTVSTAKVAFRSAIRMIPEGSNVIFCTAAIDCSENIFANPDKGDIQTLEEALSLQIESVMQVVERLVAEKKLRIWVHPMHYMPIGQPKIVVDFNDKLAHTVWSKTQVCPEIRMIDVFDQIVFADESGAYHFKPEYIIDGVHLSPNYLPLVEKSLNSEEILIEKHMIPETPETEATANPIPNASTNVDPNVEINVNEDLNASEEVNEIEDAVAPTDTPVNENI